MHSNIHITELEFLNLGVGAPEGERSQSQLAGLIIKNKWFIISL